MKTFLTYLFIFTASSHVWAQSEHVPLAELVGSAGVKYLAVLEKENVLVGKAEIRKVYHRYLDLKSKELAFLLKKGAPIQDVKALPKIDLDPNAKLVQAKDVLSDAQDVYFDSIEDLDVLKGLTLIYELNGEHSRVKGVEEAALIKDRSKREQKENEEKAHRFSKAFRYIFFDALPRILAGAIGIPPDEDF